MRARFLRTFERDCKRFVVAAQRSEGAAFVDRGPDRIDPRTSLDRDLTSEMELSKAAFDLTERAQRASQRIACVALHDAFADVLGEPDRFLTNTERVDVAPG